MITDRTVFVSGNFNVLHPGHLRLFRFARELGDSLVVGVQSDRLAGAAAYVPEQLRLEGVRSNSFVSEALLIEGSAAETIDRLRPDFVVKGKEHEDRKNPEIEVLSKYGGQLVFSSGEAVFASLDLIRKDLEGSHERIAYQPPDYLKRHGIETTELISTINDFQNRHYSN